MKSLFVMAYKDLKLLWRDRAGLFFVIGFPFLMAILFGSIFSSSGGRVSGIRVAVADEDSTATSIALTEELEKSDAIRLYPMGREDAVDKVRKGKVSAYLIIEEGFGELGAFAMFGDSGDKKFEVGMDPSRTAEAGYLRGLLTKAMFSMMHNRIATPDSMLSFIREQKKELEASSELEDEQSKLLLDYFDKTEYFLENIDSSVYSQGGFSMDNDGIEIESVERQRDNEPRSGFDITFPTGILWGLLACAASFAVSMVQERTRGTYLRLKLAPVSLAQILGGKGLACFISCISVSAALIIVGYFVFGVNIGSLGMLILAVICSGLCFVGIMMGISVLGKTEQAVGGAGWGILLIMAMFGGGMIPLAFMPSWMLTISHISPIKWGILALEGAIWRGFSFTEMLLPLGVLLGFGIVSFVIGIFVLSRYDN
ncbi:MAG: ABC transporter permease subunit [candidate division Zixibacteria bacterium]|nr:ABC transporter permease subunit [candidate division Zixibacteria bacterium]